VHGSGEVDVAAPHGEAKQVEAVVGKRTNGRRGVRRGRAVEGLGGEKASAFGATGRRER